MENYHVHRATIVPIDGLYEKLEEASKAVEESWYDDSEGVFLHSSPAEKQRLTTLFARVLPDFIDDTVKELRVVGMQVRKQGGQNGSYVVPLRNGYATVGIQLYSDLSVVNPNNMNHDRAGWLVGAYSYPSGAKIPQKEFELRKQIAKELKGRSGVILGADYLPKKGYDLSLVPVVGKSGDEALLNSHRCNPKNAAYGTVLSALCLNTKLNGEKLDSPFYVEHGKTLAMLRNPSLRLLREGQAPLRHFTEQVRNNWISIEMATRLLLSVWHSGGLGQDIKKLGIDSEAADVFHELEKQAIDKANTLIQQMNISPYNCMDYLLTLPNPS